jgi:hypothetical protein
MITASVQPSARTATEMTRGRMACG